jgi:ferredoxin-type protein NapH
MTAAATSAPRKGVYAPSAEAVRAKGWWKAHQWLVLRRASQLGILALFLLGPLNVLAAKFEPGSVLGRWLGLLAEWIGQFQASPRSDVWLVKGNLSSSLTLGVLPLTDPFLLAQTLFTRHWPEATALIGAAIVIVFYALAGGRVFCAWVCPVNMVTDGASWLRRRLNINTGRAPKRSLRHWALIAVLAACAFTGIVVWEAVNPVSMMHRAIIFGGVVAWGAVVAVFLFDLLIAPRGWCGHVCPMGAAYHLIGRKSLLRVSAQHSSRCNDCADCYAVCPEPHIIPVPLKGKSTGKGGVTPLILTSECTNCGRCLDVCSKDVFTFTHRFDHRRD